MASNAPIQTKFEPHDNQQNEETPPQDILESAMGQGLLSPNVSESNGSLTNQPSFINISTLQSS